MSLPFSLFLALKYLKPKRTFMSVITIISVVGVLLGVAVLVIVLSVMNGFDNMWREKILNFNAHLTVTKFGGEIADPADALEKIRQVPGVTGAAPYVQGLVFLQFNNRIQTPLVRGIDPRHERSVSRIPDHMRHGVFSVADDDAVIGADLASRLGLRVGDKVLVHSPQSLTKPDELRLPEEFRIAGIFEVGMWEFDSGFFLTSLGKARELYGLSRGVHAIQVMTRDPDRASLIARAIEDALGAEFEARTWMDLNRQLFSALRVEKNMMFFLLFFIAVVAGFCIACTLITVAVQKTREIGLMKAVGVPTGSILGIFFWQSWIQGLLGSGLGVGAGLLVLKHRNDLMRWLADTFHLELFPKELYHLSEIPSQVMQSDLLIVTSIVMLICTLAGAIPAWRAARLDPVPALRYE
jgi:lipoprotein-releasing system permease protein